MTRKPGDLPARVAHALVQGMTGAREFRLGDERSGEAASVCVTGVEGVRPPVRAGCLLRGFLRPSDAD
jgi:hypothetical protein